jgi:hypothetical protein
LAAARHHFADVALAPALAPAITGCGIDVVHAQVDGALHDRHRNGGAFGLLDGSLSAEAEDPDPMSRPSEIAGGHGGLRSRLLGLRHGGFRFRSDLAGHETESRGRAELQEATPVDGRFVGWLGRAHGCSGRSQLNGPPTGTPS